MRRRLDVGALAVRNGSTRVALVNMGSTPLRASAVEAALTQRPRSGDRPPAELGPADTPTARAAAPACSPIRTTTSGA